MENKTQIEGSILKEMGLDTLPEEKQMELIQKMLQVVLQRIFVEMGEKLSEADRKTLEEMLQDQTSPEEIEHFLQSKIPDFAERLNVIVANFRSEMLKI